MIPIFSSRGAPCGARRFIVPLLILLMSGCALLQDDLRPPAVNLVSISPAASSMTDLRFRCRLRLDNPNEVSLPIRGGELQLTLADRVAARGVLAEDVTIPARESREVDSIVSLNVVSAVALVTRMMADPDARIRYSIEGYVDVAVSRLGRIRFDDSGEFSLGLGGSVIPTSL